MTSKIYLSCGCVAMDDDEMENPTFSKQCPLHGAASDLLEALRNSNNFFKDVQDAMEAYFATNSTETTKTTLSKLFWLLNNGREGHEIANQAIAKAEGK